MTIVIEFSDPGELPVIDWIGKDLLDVDHKYQRPEDVERVRRIAEAFSWTKFGAIVVAPKPDGRFNVVDGQHRAMAAMMHPMVTTLPAVILTGVTGVPAEAQSFIGLNGDRKAVSPLQMHHAAVAAGDEDEMTVAVVCQRAGVTVLRYPPGKGGFKPGQTIAVGAIRKVIDRHGVIKARQFLDVLVRAKVAPITGSQIAAVAILLTDAEFCDEVDAEDVADALLDREDIIDKEAGAFASAHCVPRPKGNGVGLVQAHPQAAEGSMTKRGKQFDERWSNEKSALVGFYVGRGRLAPSIASILRDGTTAETIRTMINRWGIPRGEKRSMAVPIQLEAKYRLKLWRAATRHGCKPEELLRRIAVAVLEDDLIAGVLDVETPEKAPDSS